MSRARKKSEAATEVAERVIAAVLEHFGELEDEPSAWESVGLLLAIHALSRGDYHEAVNQTGIALRGPPKDGGVPREQAVSLAMLEALFSGIRSVRAGATLH